MENTKITPSEYFTSVKDKKVWTNDEELSKFYESCMVLINKYNITGQKEALAKIIFVMECIEKERELVKLGINTFVYKDDIEEYIDDVARNTVKIIELENYEREIPDELLSTIEKSKEIFDVMYVVFTDYTGRIEKKVESYRRDKDPILFGTFQNRESQIINDRFYYLGDWIDEYCDLTLDKMISEVGTKLKKNIDMKISTPTDLEKVKQEIDRYKKEKNDRFRMLSPGLTKKSFFAKIKAVFQ